MSSIHLLGDDAINKIAAGEVVERPESVVKELVENSVDAGAKSIEVETMAGGTSFIRVTDDGCGMTREDARLAMKRHATSKIKTAQDIMTISTMGFRGEALPTIASVSRFTLTTRVEGSELGTKIMTAGGERPDILAAGCGVGTTVTVEDLFFNTPARKKFMRTTRTEGQRVAECVTRAALANPGIAFRFISNSSLSLVTPGTGDLKDAIESIYGGSVAGEILPLDFADTDITIKGWISKPSTLRASRSWQTFIVNGRVIESKAIARAIDNAYHSLLPKAGYPLAVLDINVPPTSVDINVHPRKTEIKFEDESRIFRAAYKAVVDAVHEGTESLGGVAYSPRTSERSSEKYLPPDSSAPPAVKTFLSGGASSRHSGAFMSKDDAADFFAAQEMIRSERGSAAPTLAAISGDDVPGCEKKDAPEPVNMTALGQVALCYIVAHDADNLYLIDQHAAHERILYDRFSAMAGDIPSQQLLVHLALDFSEDEAHLLETHQEVFLRLGFDFSPSGTNEFRLRAVPTDVPVELAEDTLRKILSVLSDMGEPTADGIRHACLAMTACKAAIKRGDALNMSQMKMILEELSATSRPYTCPHGRPTILRFGSGELARMFKRTGFYFPKR